jgi:hypothetical protein
MATERWKTQTALLTNQIPAQVIQEGDKTVCSATHKLISSICSKEELPQQMKAVDHCTYLQGG